MLEIGTAVVLLALASSLGSSAYAQAPAEPGTAALAAVGERILAEKCERCHAIHRTDESKLPAAPPFRTLSRKYPLDQLSEALAEGITTGHDAMPEFIFSTEEISAILAHLETIAEPAPGR